jgi:hypothetical protein
MKRALCALSLLLWPTSYADAQCQIIRTNNPYGPRRFLIYSVKDGLGYVSSYNKMGLLDDEHGITG